MNKVAKIIAGICLGFIVIAGIKVEAQAKTEYYVTNNAVYAVDSKNPWAPYQLAAGAIIPANSTVYVNYNCSRLATNYGLFSQVANKGNVYSFTTSNWGAVGYSDGAVWISNQPTVAGYVGPCINNSVCIAPNANPYWYDYYAAAAAAYYWGYYTPVAYGWGCAPVVAYGPCAAPAVPGCNVQVVSQPQVTVQTTNYVYEVNGMQISMDIPQVVIQ